MGKEIRNRKVHLEAISGVQVRMEKYFPKLDKLFK